MRLEKRKENTEMGLIKDYNLFVLNFLGWEKVIISKRRWTL
jgi:hypothetical protein